MRVAFLLACLLLTASSSAIVPQSASATAGFLPGARVLLDAHNAYPYEGRYADRIDRALATGLPLAIEQDLAWCRSASGAFAPLVSHETACTGTEPTLEAHFFERVRPLMEAALARGPSSDWPLVTLNLDFKSNEAEHHAAVWELLGKYERWLTTAPGTGPYDVMAALTPGPLLVLTGDSDLQEQTFAARQVPRLRVFGAIHSRPPADANDRAELPRPTAATNYRRWWNHPWRVIEIDGPPKAGGWTAEDEGRLRTVVADAHHHSLWIRFYTLNGHAAGAGQGWFDGYNFGSERAAATRWRAAVEAGVDFIATDQYESFAAARGRADVAPERVAHLPLIRFLPCRPLRLPP